MLPCFFFSRNNHHNILISSMSTTSIVDTIANSFSQLQRRDIFSKERIISLRRAFCRSIGCLICLYCLCQLVLVIALLIRVCFRLIFSCLFFVLCTTSVYSKLWLLLTVGSISFGRNFRREKQSSWMWRFIIPLLVQSCFILLPLIMSLKNQRTVNSSHLSLVCLFFLLVFRRQRSILQQKTVIRLDGLPSSLLFQVDCSTNNHHHHHHCPSKNISPIIRFLLLTQLLQIFIVMIIQNPLISINKIIFIFLIPIVVDRHFRSIYRFFNPMDLHVIRRSSLLVQFHGNLFIESQFHSLAWQLISEYSFLLVHCFAKDEIFSIEN